MTAGLYIEQANRLKRMAELAYEVTAPDILPADEHSKRVEIERLRQEVAERSVSIQAQEAFVEELREMCEAIRISKFQSAHRTLALRHLEDAESRLLRELGDKID